jgi:hypothetical protein
MRILIVALSLGLMAFTSCKQCKNEDPIARVQNNGTSSVSVHIQTSGGNTVNINNIDPGQVSNYERFAAGLVSYTISVGNGGSSQNYYTNVTMGQCYQYDIILNSDNTLSTVAVDLND